jgi:hypothetical protein
MTSSPPTVITAFLQDHTGIKYATRTSADYPALRVNYAIQVSADKKTARIGGGILFRNLLEGLGNHGLITPVGTIGTVGYVGWATLGGYGPYSASYGLGLDQIVGAKVVNADGRLVDADARMLKGIRGSGGNYGVIVELTIKVYPVQEVSLVNHSLCYQFLLIMSTASHSLIHPTLEYKKHSYVVHERKFDFACPLC